MQRGYCTAGMRGCSWHAAGMHRGCSERAAETHREACAGMRRGTAGEFSGMRRETTRGGCGWRDREYQWATKKVSNQLGADGLAPATSVFNDACDIGYH
jgi:hypothetical protein